MRSSFLLLLSCIASFTWAQAPERMSFQAVVRDAADMLVTNGDVTLRMSILQGSANGTPVFVETHSATTNANGLVTVELGGGTVVSGSVGSIDWGSGPYFLRTETDPLGGSNYSISGASELLSVPYALHAANNMPGPAGPQGPPGVAGCDMVRSGNMVVVYTPTHAYGFNQSESSGSLNTGNWKVTTLSGNVIGAVASENTIVVYTSTHAYGLYQSQMSGSLNTANWAVTTLDGNVIDAVSNMNQIAVYTSSHAYGFYQSESSQSLNSGNWKVTTLDGVPMGAVPSRQQIVVYTTTHAYGFYQSQSSQSLNIGNWSVTTLDGTPAGALPTR
ncbi:MAG: hypothetical protein WBG34_12055 [Flavobacteriales bacterium]